MVRLRIMIGYPRRLDAGGWDIAALAWISHARRVRWRAQVVDLIEGTIRIRLIVNHEKGDLAKLSHPFAVPL